MDKYSMERKQLAEHIAQASNGKIDRSVVAAAAAGDATKLMNALSAEDRKRITDIINDKAELSRLMNKPAMQEIIKKLSGGNKNG